MRFFVLLSMVLLTNVAIAQLRYPSEPAGQQESKEAQQSATEQETAKPDSRGSEESPLVVRVYKSQEESTDDKKERGNHAATDRWVIGIGVATAFILIIQAGVFAWQGWQLRRTVQEMKVATNATKDAAAAAQKSADIAEATLVATQRPWIRLNAIMRGDINIGNGKRSEIILSKKNVGASPAINIWDWVEFFGVNENPGKIEDIVKDRMRMAKNNFRTDIGTSLFPGEEFKNNIEMIADKLKISGNMSHCYAGTLLCCCAYSFTFGDNTPRYYAEWYMVVIRGIDHSGKVDSFPKEQVQLFRTDVYAY